MSAHTPNPAIIVWDANEGDGHPPRPLWCIGTRSYREDLDDEKEPAIYAELHVGFKEDADRMARCWNTHAALYEALRAQELRNTMFAEMNMTGCYPDRCDPRYTPFIGECGEHTPARDRFHQLDTIIHELRKSALTAAGQES